MVVIGISEWWVDLRICLDCEGFGCACVGEREREIGSGHDDGPMG